MALNCIRHNWCTAAVQRLGRISGSAGLTAFTYFLKLKIMQIPASTILSFVTGRLYSTTPPTVLFGDMLSVATGEKSIYTHQLPELRAKFASKILAQCPTEFQKICNEWQHTADWQKRVDLVDDAFGTISISYCG